jgi:hypothetical protein
MRKLSILFVITVILLLTAAPAAASSPPLDVEFVAPTILPEYDPPYGTFTATGPAVDAGIVCPMGTTLDIFDKAAGYQSQTGINFQSVKIFTCDDGSGTFFVKLQVRVDEKGDNFNWNIIDGTGAYERLHGTGSGYGEYTDYGVLDLYDGKLHID